MSATRKVQLGISASIFLGLTLLFVAVHCIPDEGAGPGQPPAEVMGSGEAQEPGATAATPETVAPKARAAGDQLLAAAAAPAAGLALPQGEVLVPATLFGGKHRLDRKVLASNPRLYLHPDFRPGGDSLLVVGMPGWGGRSENFIWVLINALKGSELGKNVVVAAIQDTANGGPLYQGQGDRAHANVWSLGGESVEVVTHFVSTLSRSLGRLQVTFIGFSTGGTSAPRLAERVARSPLREGFRVSGAVAVGTGSSVLASRLKETNLRVLFLVVPEKRAQDPRPMRDDQWNRISAETAFDRLQREGAEVHLRHVESARQHVDWHWGLISQCRYFKGSRIDSGRGYWPNYWMPNPETTIHLQAFLEGRVPPVRAEGWTPSTCLY